MVAGFVKYLLSARMDRTVPRFTVQYSRCAASRDLLRFSWLVYPIADTSGDFNRLYGCNFAENRPETIH